MTGRANIGDVGFDLVRARDALSQFIIERGASPPPVNDLREPYGWQEGFSLAQAHAHEALTDRPGVHPAIRMLARGAARALYEVCVHHMDVKAIELVAALDTALDHVRVANRRLELSMENIQDMLGQFEDDAQTRAMFKEHRDVLRMVELLTEAEATAARLAVEFDSRLLSTAVGPSEQEGRRPQLLLNAVWQHLWEAGFEARETCTLIPDELSQPGDNAMVRRVRFRVKQPVPKISFPL